MTVSTKRKVKRSSVKKDSEHKQQFINLPLDVFIEIFLFLEPLDLLHLARTIKCLRGFLLNRGKSSALWKNAIGNVKDSDFPPCPDHMSAPAYTHLAFVPACHGCFCPCEAILWELRMRCCEDCFPKMTITPPLSTLRRKTESHLKKLDLPKASTHYKLSDNSVLDITVSTGFPKRSFSLLDWKVAQSRKRPLDVSTEEFLAEQNDFWGSVQRHAGLCRNWERRRLKAKAAQLSLVRRKRVDDIKAELKRLGWTDFTTSSMFLRLPQVRKLEPLTPTGE
ncbi:hypothetical protein OG21DRAFT_1210848 [Imleria badia]|nr:hypothetical protein OG21DRAFT_1210848 [Imleria badia]